MKNRTNGKLFILILITLLVISIGCSKKTSDSSEQKAANETPKIEAPKYDTLDSSIKYELAIWKVYEVSKTGNQLVTNYQINGIKVNGHEIDLVDSVKIVGYTGVTDSSLELKTKNYGTMLVKLRKGQGKNELFGFQLFMTQEQQAKMKDLR
jgi:hypothetical protein